MELSKKAINIQSMKLCVKYRLICRIKHHLRKRAMYKRKHEEEAMIYGIEASVYDELYQKQQWHLRYSTRLKKLLNKC